MRRFVTDEIEAVDAYKLMSGLIVPSTDWMDRNPVN